MNNQTEQIRVIEVHGNKYVILKDKQEYQAVLTGKLLYNEQYPIVGDYVDAIIQEYGDAIITNIHERKTYISRPDRSGHSDGFVKTMIEQPMVANVDYCFIVTSLNDDFSVNRIIRYAAMLNNSNIVPVVILSKCDLCENQEYYINEVKQIYPSATVIPVSSVTNEGIEQIKEYFKEGITIALMGSSGAGKSTLINTVLGKDVMRVSNIREKDSKGRHTTTHRQLIETDGVSIIDTPGMRELGIMDISDGIDSTFEDIEALQRQCKFSNCTHEKEPGCAIQEAILTNRLTKERWEMYISLQRESNWSKSMKAKKQIEISKKRNMMKGKGKKKFQ